jgi:hypothetical protein
MNLLSVLKFFLKKYGDLKITVMSLVNFFFFLFYFSNFRFHFSFSSFHNKDIKNDMCLFNKYTINNSIKKYKYKIKNKNKNG